MIERISRLADFIAWENFTRASVWGSWAVGLLLIFASLFCFVLFSYAVMPRKTERRLEELVLRAGLGMAILTFLLVVGVFLKILTLAWLAGSVVLMSALALFRNPNSFSCAARLIAFSLSHNKWYWLLFIFCSQPALLPPLWVDETGFHLSVAWRLVREGGLFVDEGLRYPYYTFNFQTLHSVGGLLDSFVWNHLLSWLCGALATLGIVALLQRERVHRLVVTVSSLAFFLTPAVQQHLHIAYIDVPLMWFAFLSAYALYLYFQGNREPGFLFAMALIHGMFAGMKPTNAAFLALFFVVLLFARNWRMLRIYFVVAALSGSVWFVRNIALTGDPVPPLFSHILFKKNTVWNQKDIAFQKEDLTIKKDFGWQKFYKVPLEWLMQESDRVSKLRYAPLLLYVLLFPVSLSLWFVRGISLPVRILLLVGAAGFLFWCSTSVYTRYAHFLPVWAVGSALLLNRGLQSASNRGRVVRLASGALLVWLVIGPKHYALSSLKGNFSRSIPVGKAEVSAFVGWYDPPYMLDFVECFSEAGVRPQSAIYAYNMRNYRYYVEQQGYYLLGDAVGAYRFGDMKQNLKQGHLREYFVRHGIDYLLVDRTRGPGFPGDRLPEGFYIVLENERYMLLHCCF